jgi:hypothetical protein
MPSCIDVKRDSRSPASPDGKGHAAERLGPKPSTLRSWMERLDIRRWLRLAAATHDLSIRRYVLQAIEERRREDLGEDAEGVASLTATTDPVLANLWDNRKDAEYDRV